MPIPNTRQYKTGGYTLPIEERIPLLEKNIAVLTAEGYGDTAFVARLTYQLSVLEDEKATGVHRDRNW